jgi:O-antigen/teichoic acid export membrane protein
MSKPPVDALAAAEDVSEPKASTFEQNINVVASGGGVTFSGKLFTNVLRLGTAILLARILGADELGLYNLALSGLSIAMGISLFGLDAALVRFIAVMAGRSDDEGIWDVLQVGMGISLLLSAILGTGLFALSYVAADSLFHEPRLAPALQLASVFVPLMVIYDQLGNVLKGFKKFNEAVVAQYVYQPIVRLALIGLLAIIGLNAKTAVIAYGFGAVSSSVAMIYSLNKHFPLRRPLRLSLKILKEMMIFSVPVWLSGLLNQFQGNIQSVFIGTMNTIAGVGVFGVASQITSVSGEFSSSISSTSKPVMAELQDRGDVRQMERIYQTANKWVAIVQIPIFLLMVIFPSAILSIFGESYVDGSTALIILAVASFIKVITGMGGIIIDMAGYTNLKLLNSVLRLGLYIGLDYLLIPRFGLVGASIAVLVGEGGVNLLRLAQVYFIFGILPVNPGFVRLLLAPATALASVLLLTTWLPSGTNLVHATIKIGIMFGTYAAVMLLFGLTDDEKTLFKGFYRQAVTAVRKRVQHA